MTKTPAIKLKQDLTGITINHLIQVCKEQAKISPGGKLEVTLRDQNGDSYILILEKVNPSIKKIITDLRKAPGYGR